MVPERLTDLFAAMERSDDRVATATYAHRLVRALPAAHPDDLRALRERMLAAVESLAHAERPDDAFLLGLTVMTLAVMPAERDIAERQCPRCRRRTLRLHVLRRPLNRFERRACTQCEKKHLAEGWRHVVTENIDLRCRTCSQMAKPTHVVALAPSPIEAIACDDCADELKTLGWRAAVTRSFT
jgi:hypothetical protein